VFSSRSQVTPKCGKNRKGGTFTKSSEFLSSEHPCELKNLDDALNTAGVEKAVWKTWGCGQHWWPFDSKERY